MNIAIKSGLETKRKGLFVVISVVIMIAMFFASGVGVNAAVNKTTPRGALTGYVYTQMQNKTYDKEGGGTVKGSNLFKSNSGEYELQEDVFLSLTGSAQKEVVSDMANLSEEKVDKDSSQTGQGKVTEETVQNWWKDLQSKKGVGSKFMNVLLEDTKPDFVTANQIYQPFSGVVGTLMGIIAVVGMSFLGLVLVADIFYITLPPVRLFVSDDNSNKGARVAVSKIFSNDAIYAVKVAEGEDGGDGNKKQALGIYLKRRVVMLILLGICLLYLVQGQVFTLVGWVLDLVSGFLGF